jgi:hypothetical protein
MVGISLVFRLTAQVEKPVALEDSAGRS